MAETQQATPYVGDWDTKGPDYETTLCGAVTERIVDADRVVRFGFRNGIPNWDLYRTVLAQDSIHFRKLRDWIFCFTEAYCLTGGVRRDAYREDLSFWVSVDVLHILTHKAEAAPYTVLAKVAGVHHETYRRVRRVIYLRLLASLNEYMSQLVPAYRELIRSERREIYERKRGSRKTGVSMEVMGSEWRGFAPGCSRAAPATESDSL